MKPVDVNDNTYIDSMKFHCNDKDLRFKVGNHVKISKYKTFLHAKLVWRSFHGHMLLMIQMAMKLLEHSMKKNYKRLISKNLG